jgi:two-component system, chemotaxis family, CheB/CheR fusion protein
MARRKRDNEDQVQPPVDQNGVEPGDGRRQEAVSPVEAGLARAAPGTAEGEPAPGFAVVGLGASAGGLSAFERFFRSIPPDGHDSLAFVVVQHLDPNHESILRSLLQQHTTMPVRDATDGVQVQPGFVYIIPHNRDMTILGGRLRLTEPLTPRGLRLPIDTFFRSLASDMLERAAGIVLSGTGTDGTLGIKAIKESGGLVMVQEPESAQYDGMPRSAISTGLVDYVSPPEAMPEQLLGFLRQVSRGRRTSPAAPSTDHSSAALQRIFVLLRTHTGHDFSRYKANTILRRIDRRMAFHRLEDLENYARLLQQTPAEIDVLFKELLIGVTNFFRDPQAFHALQEEVIPLILASKEPGDSVRVWVPGCSTGEEAFSIAILLHESLRQASHDVQILIFATDIDAAAIEQARTAVYPNSIAADVSPERLARYFTPEGDAYRVRKIIRDSVVFAEQNLITDPPFSRIDLISCRNLLIYLGPELQKRVVPLFHYALNPNGYLFLGASEGVGDYNDLFAPVDRKWKIFLRRGPDTALRADVARVATAPDASTRRAPRDDRPRDKVDVRQLVERVLLAEHTPAVAVVSGTGDVTFFHGRTGRYLEPAPGEASLNILRMAREGLRLELTTALHRAVGQREAVHVPGLRIKSNGSTYVVNLTVRPLGETATKNGLYLVLFQEIAEERSGARRAARSVPSEKDERIAVLERELRGKEEYLQSTIEELETANEEMTSTNEELQSANEELQSTNEELETSKEELQSVNEELMTVNTELQKKIEELARVNNDLNNLLAGTGIGTVFVDYGLRIQRFTPAITEIINLIQTDVGRPVSHIVSNLTGYEDLVEDVSEVLDRLAPKEMEVQLKDGRWFLMRIQPYRTIENRIEGAVITFVNITEQKKLQVAEAELRQEADRLRGLTSFLRDSMDALAVLDLSGRIMGWNPAAERLYGWSERDALELTIGDISAPVHEGEWQEIRTRAERLEAVAPFETKRKTSSGEFVRVSSQVTHLLNAEGRAYGVALMERPVDVARRSE